MRCPAVATPVTLSTARPGHGAARVRQVGTSRLDAGSLLSMTEQRN